MIIAFRWLAILLAVAIILLAGAFVLTRDRRHLARAWLLLKVGVAGGILFFGVLIFERLWSGGP